MQVLRISIIPKDSQTNTLIHQLYTVKIREKKCPRYDFKRWCEVRLVKKKRIIFSISLIMKQKKIFIFINGSVDIDNDDDDDINHPK